jgi:hypothetical protein
MIAINTLGPTKGIRIKNKREINKHEKIAAQLVETAELHLEIAKHLSSDNFTSAFEIAANAFVILNKLRENQHKIIYKMR